MNLIKVNNLNLSIHEKEILKGLSFEGKAGEILGIIGESGSGKSMTANSIIKLLPFGSSVTGEIILQNKNLLETSEEEMCTIRGRDIGFIFQEPMTALNPLKTIGEQVSEVIRIHKKINKFDALNSAATILDRVGLPQTDFPSTRYPFELSGGQRQRVVIAMAIAIKPKLIIADEPSTALDVTTQAKLIKLLKKLVIEDNICLIMITHDLSVIAEMADKIIIMRNGEIVERGKINILKNGLKNDYSKNLLKASNYKSKNLNKKISNQTLLKVDNISRHYSDNSFRFFGEKKVFKAVKNVSFSINYNENVGLVGESGCGKSTITRAILGLDPIINGKIILEGDEIKASNVSKNIRKKLQVVFQDPYGSFNPRHNVLKLISEPLYLEQSQISDYEKLNLVKELLEHVGLNAEDHKKFIHEFSGGQRQRIAIARSLILKPKLIILDEAVSALDVSIRAQILDLLVELSESYGLSYLFISHDLSLVKSITSRVLVMKSGQIVESGNTKDIFNSPSHAYTKSLIASSPNLESSLRKLT